MNIVIADDEQIIWRWMKKNLEELSEEYHVINTCMNGKQALNSCLNQKVDILFTDIRMPVMDGLELLEKLKINNVMPYTVVLSAYSDFSYVRDAFKLGAGDYLLKTEITRESLKKCLEQAAVWQQNRIQKISTDEEQKSLLETGLELFFKENDGRILQNMELYQKSFQELYDDQYGIGILHHYNGELSLIQIREMISLLFGERKNYVQFIQKNMTEIILIMKVDTYGRQQVMQNFSDYLAAFGMKEILFVLSDTGTDLSTLETIWADVQQMRQDMLFYKKIGAVEGRKRYTQEKMEIRMENSFCDIQNCMEKGTTDELRKSVSRFMAWISSECLPVATVKQKVIDFILNIYWNQLEGEQRKVLKTTDIYQLNSMGQIEIFELEVIQCLLKIRQLVAEVKQKNRYSDSVNKVIAYISDFYGREISLNDLANYVHLNRSYLSTCFKKEVGVNIHTYLLHYRLERAKEQLASSNKQVQQIGEEVGIADLAYFSKQFKRYTGDSPLEYRRKHK